MLESNESEKEETGFQKLFSDGRMLTKFERLRTRQPCKQHTVLNSKKSLVAETLGRQELYILKTRRRDQHN